MRERVLITGVDGFIGSSLWRFFLKQYPSFELIGVSHWRESPSNKIICCNLTNQKKILSLLDRFRPQYIFHLAGGRKGSDREIFQSNFITSLRLFEAVVKLKGYHPRIIIPATAAEYGIVSNATKLVTENSLPAPVTWYGFSKHLQTSLSLWYAREGLNIVVARLFNIMGWGCPSNLVIGKFALNISLIERGIKAPVLETATLSGKRDFLDVDDVCSGLWSVAQKGKTGEIYHVCSGHSYIIKKLIKKLTKFSHVRNIKIREKQQNTSGSYDCIGSNSKLKKKSEWRPRVSVDESLRRCLDYYRELDKKKVSK